MHAAGLSKPQRWTEEKGENTANQQKKSSLSSTFEFITVEVDYYQSKSTLKYTIRKPSFIFTLEYILKAPSNKNALEIFVSLFKGCTRYKRKNEEKNDRPSWKYGTG